MPAAFSTSFIHHFYHLVAAAPHPRFILMSYVHELTFLLTPWAGECDNECGEQKVHLAWEIFVPHFAIFCSPRCGYCAVDLILSFVILRGHVSSSRLVCFWSVSVCFALLT